MLRGEAFRDTRRGALAPGQLVGSVDAMMASARHGRLQAALLEASIVELLRISSAIHAHRVSEAARRRLWAGPVGREIRADRPTHRRSLPRP